MRLNAKWLTATGGLFTANIVRSWMSTLDYQAAFHDRTLDPAHEDYRGPCIFLFWHEYIPFLFYLRGYCNIAMLLSRHQDAEWLSQAARHMGFDTVRGSTNRGGVVALRELFRLGQATNLAITPDGPRGPRRQLAAGSVYLASRLNIPIVTIGLGYDRPWRVQRAWDKFAVPRLGTRARAVVGPRLEISPTADRDELEVQRLHVEKMLNDLTTEAERWAEAGGRPPQRVPVCRESQTPPPAKPLRMHAA